MPTENDMGYNDRDKEHPHEIPPKMNGSQSPQLNHSVRCHSCGCEVNQDIGEGGDGPGDADAAHFRNGASPTHHDRRGRGVTSVRTDSYQGDEGLEKNKFEQAEWTRHKVDIPGYGLIPLRAIFRGLAEHRFCTCHPSGLFPVSGDNSPDLSGMISVSSLCVEVVSSGEQSTQNSGYLPRISSSAYLEFLTLVGVHLMNTIPFDPSLTSFFNDEPLALTDPPSRGVQLPIGYPYPEEAQISDEESSDDEDDWTTINPEFQA